MKTSGENGQASGDLFQSVRLGPYKLANRIVMAPLTRSRASEDGVPRPMANNGYNRELALDARRRNRADLISFGRLFIANPDLVERLRVGATLNVPDRATFFGGGTAGYTDYPALTAEERIAVITKLSARRAPAALRPSHR